MELNADDTLFKETLRDILEEMLSSVDVTVNQTAKVSKNNTFHSKAEESVGKGIWADELTNVLLPEAAGVQRAAPLFKRIEDVFESGSHGQRNLDSSGLSFSLHPLRMPILTRPACAFAGQAMVLDGVEEVLNDVDEDTEEVDEKDESDSEDIEVESDHDEDDSEAVEDDEEPLDEVTLEMNGIHNLLQLLFAPIQALEQEEDEEGSGDHAVVENDDDEDDELD